MCEKVLIVNKPEILVPSRNFYKGSFRVGLNIRLSALRSRTLSSLFYKVILNK